MTRSELAQRLAKANPALTDDLADQVVRAIFDEIANGLAAGRRIELRKFGTFTLRSRGSYAGRNPKTGEPVAVNARRMIHWRRSKSLDQRLQMEKR